MDALVAAAPGAVPPPGLRRIPPAGVVPLGRAWSGNSVNCVPFRQSPLLRLPDGTDVASFFDADGQVVIAWPARTTPAGRAVIRNDRMPFDAHQAISLGRDPYGRIHVAFGAHNSTIRVSRSQGRDLRAGFSPAADLPEPPATWGLDPRLTYPMFVRTARELILLFRRGPHADGALHVSRLDEFGAWQPDDLPIASGRLAVPSCGPYLNAPVVTTNDAIQCFLVWRLPADATGGGAVNNVGIDGFRSEDGLRSLLAGNGLRLRSPVTPATADRILAVGPGRTLINQAGAAPRPNGGAGFVSYWSQPAGRSRPRPVPQYRLGWQDGSGTWCDTPASAFTTPFDLDGGGTLPLPHSRPELLFDDADRAFVLWRSIETGNRLMLRVLSPPDYDIRDSEAVVLWDHDLGFYEPVPSRDAWQRDRELVLLVQHCDQKRDHDGTPHAGGTPIVLARWNHDQLLP